MKSYEIPPRFTQNKYIHHLYARENGDIFDSKTGYVYKNTPGARDNAYVTVYDYPASQIVMTTFNPDVPINTVMVNHIDGVKDNNALDNLEWTTYSRNIIHAYKSGLRTDNKVTYVTNTRTGKIDKFYSQASASRFLGVSPATITLYLQDRVRLLNGKFLISRDPSIRLSPEELSKLHEDYDHTSGNPKSVWCWEKETDKIRRYKTGAEAARAYGISDGTVYLSIKNYRSVCDDKYIFRYDGDDRGWSKL